MTSSRALAAAWRARDALQSRRYHACPGARPGARSDASAARRLTLAAGASGANHGLLHSGARYVRSDPTAAAADKFLADQVAARTKTTDANDLIYCFRASEDYDPSPHLGEITAPLLAINSADDQLNPPELNVVEPAIKRIPGARFVLIPASEKTSEIAWRSMSPPWRTI